MLGWLPWQDAAELAGATGATWAATRRSVRPCSRALKPWAKELTLILALYGLWQYAGAWSIGRASVALSRGETIWRWERAWRLPSERSTQALVLHHPTVVRLFNDVYFYAHVPALGVCLIWLFVRHRDRYPPVRTVVALVTGASLAIQLFPVAPPRLLPQLRIVDTPALFGPNVYRSGAPGLDQLAAMPSIHVGWALIVGGAIVWVCRSRWRWLGLVFPALTLVTVVVTGNHYWLDGVVVAVLCGLATLFVAWAYGGERGAAAGQPAASEPGRGLPEADDDGAGEAVSDGLAVGTAYGPPAPDGEQRQVQEVG